MSSPTPTLARRSANDLDRTSPVVSTLALVNPNPGMAMDRAHKPDYQFPLELRSLPIPHAYAAEVEALRNRARLSNPKQTARFDESIRLRIHFGGMHVACVKTPQGTIVVAASYPGSGTLRRELKTYRGDPEAIIIESPQPLGSLQEARY